MDEIEDQDQDEQQARIALGAALTHVAQWEAAVLSRGTGRWRPEPGSPLVGDDRVCDPYHLSHAALRYIAQAADHVRCLRDVLTRPAEPVLPIWAGYSLLRPALENASTAIWILGPARRDERVTRWMQCVLDNAKHADRVAALNGNTQNPRLPRVRDRLEGLLTAAGITDSRLAFARLPMWEDRVSEAAEIGGFTERNRPVVTWKMCSAVAHGDLWGILSGVDLEDLGREGNVRHTHMTVNTPTLAGATQATVAIVDAAVRLFRLRGQAPR